MHFKYVTQPQQTHCQAHLVTSTLGHRPQHTPELALPHTPLVIRHTTALSSPAASVYPGKLEAAQPLHARLLQPVHQQLQVLLGDARQLLLRGPLGRCCAGPAGLLQPRRPARLPLNPTSPPTPSKQQQSAPLGLPAYPCACRLPLCCMQADDAGRTDLATATKPPTSPP
jgi:hypothetical protein